MKLENLEKAIKLKARLDVYSKIKSGITLGKCRVVVSDVHYLMSESIELAILDYIDSEIEACMELLEELGVE